MAWLIALSIALFFVILCQLKVSRKKSEEITKLVSFVDELYEYEKEAKVAMKDASEIIDILRPMAVKYHRMRTDRMNEDYVERSICASLVREAVVDSAYSINLN